MKKLIPLLFLGSSIIVFVYYSNYTKGSFNYHVAQFIGYIFYWSVALFIGSLAAFVIDQKKYKTWLLSTIIYVLFSIFIAYMAGDGGGGIVSFDGKDLTLILAGLYLLFSIFYSMTQFFKTKKSAV
jgi:hypothetical protein